MKPFLSAVFILSALAVGLATYSQAATLQAASRTTGAQDVKHIETTLPDNGGSVWLAALSINRDWTTSMVHLRGNVRVEMWLTHKQPQALILTADTVDFNENTGEIVPYGNVRIKAEVK